MIEQQGIVVDTSGEFAWVETQRESSCGGCAAKSGCGTALLNRSIGKRFNRIRVSNDVGARTGDCVVLGIPEQALLKGSFAVYLVPLIAMLGGATIAHLAGAGVAASGWHDLVTLLGGAIGFVVGLYWVRRFGERVGNGVGFQPVLLRRVADRHQSLVTSSHYSG